jgi:hypothetical protein
MQSEFITPRVLHSGPGVLRRRRRRQGWRSRPSLHVPHGGSDGAAQVAMGGTNVFRRHRRWHRSKLRREINIATTGNVFISAVAHCSQESDPLVMALGLPFGSTRCSMSSLPRLSSVNQRVLQRLGAHLLRLRPL